MQLKIIIKKLKELSDKGYIKSLRKGSTGIGYMLESELGINETNIAIPDIGGRVELKATRKEANSLITLFTFNRGVWRVKQTEIINKFGYLDEGKRLSLYNTVNYRVPNSRGFYLLINKEKNIISLYNGDESIAEWSAYAIAGKFMSKLDRLLLVLANTKVENGVEFFHYNEAYLLQNPKPEKFLESFINNKTMIDLRMHIKKNGGVRNHGTGFRIFEKDLVNLYVKKERLI